MAAHARRALVACAFVALLSPLRAQDAALGADEAKVRWVDGRPMLKVTLRAGDKLYYCHLLIDLSTPRPLFLHKNAAGSLHAEECDVEAGGIVLKGLGFEAKRDQWLEGLTAEYAEPLQQVPVAGIVGLSAFGDRDVILDGPNSVLKLRPATPVGSEAPPAAADLAVVEVSGSTAKGLRVPVDLGGDVSASLSLHTRDPFSWLDPELCKRVGHADGVLQHCRAGLALDIAQWTPFRPLRSQSGLQGGIGGAVLQQLVLHVQPAAGRIVVGMPKPPVYPEVEAAFYRAVFGSKDPAALREFLQQHGDAPQAAEASAALFERELEGEGGLEALQFAGLQVVKSAAKNKKGTAALEVLEKLPGRADAFAARAAIAEAGLADARADEDGNAAHKLRLELGAQQRILGNAAAARRHLLSAVFGMPASGPANLELGHWHRDQGELEAALNRYFLAVLDMKNTGQQGYAAFVAAWKKQHGSEDGMLADLEDRADGRIPSFQPIPREPGTVKKTGRTVLVELFTGAMCPPCVAADVACDGLAQLYDRDEVVVLQWHLPIPQPEPLVAPVSLQRGEARGVSGTPTVVVPGGEPVVGGGKVDQAPEMFRKYRELVDAQLARPPVAAIEASAKFVGDRVVVEAKVAAVPPAAVGKWRLHALLVEHVVVFPGANGMLFHHEVVRGALTPPDGAPVVAGAGARPFSAEQDLGELGQELEQQVAELEKDKPFLVRPVVPAKAGLAVVVFVQDADTVLQAKLVPIAGAAAEGGR